MMQGMDSMAGACLSGMGGMMAFMGALWVVVIAGIVHVARRVWHTPQLTAVGGPTNEAVDAALATLRGRFARGEIGRAEYEERRRALIGDEARWP